MKGYFYSGLREPVTFSSTCTFTSSRTLFRFSFGICSSCCSNAFSIILNARRAPSLRAADRGGFGHNARNTRDSEPQLYDLWSHQ